MSDQPQGPNSRQGVPVWVFVVSLLAVAAVAASLAWILRSPAPVVTPVGQTAAPTTTVDVTVDTPAVSTTVAVEPTVAPPAAKADLPYTPGPDESGKDFAYVRKMAVKNGYVYVTVDYVLIGDDPEGGWMITNDNPKLRTFPLAKNCPCRYYKEDYSGFGPVMKPLAFRAKWAAAPGDQQIRANPYELTLKHGVVTKLDNVFLP